MARRKLQRFLPKSRSSCPRGFRPGWRKRSRKAARTPDSPGPRVLFEPLEPRLLLSGDPFFAAIADGDLTLRLTDDAETLQIIETGTDNVLAEELLSNLDGESGYAVRIEAEGYDVDLTIDEGVMDNWIIRAAGGVHFEAGTGDDSLFVSGDDLSTLILDSAGSGHLVMDGTNLSYSDVESVDSDDQVIGTEESAALLETGQAWDDMVDSMALDGSLHSTLSFINNASLSDLLEDAGLPLDSALDLFSILDDYLGSDNPTLTGLMEAVGDELDAVLVGGGMDSDGVWLDLVLDASVLTSIGRRCGGALRSGSCR